MMPVMQQVTHASGFDEEASSYVSNFSALHIALGKHQSEVPRETAQSSIEVPGENALVQLSIYPLTTFSWYRAKCINMLQTPL